MEYLILSLSERRQMNAGSVKPEKKVAAEGALFHFVFNIRIGGADDANIGLDLFQSTNSIELFFLQNPQELCLQFKWHLCDLVQKECSAKCQVEACLFDPWADFQ